MMDSTVKAVGEIFGVEKEAAIALALIKAPQAIANVWAEAGKKPTLPQVALHGVGGTAMVLAPIVKGLKDIKKVNMKGKSSGGGGGSISSSVGVGSINVDDLSANNAANLNAEAGLNSSASAAAAANVNGSSSNGINFVEGQFNDFLGGINFVEGQSNIGDD
jgi:hypothetical protein